MITLCGRPNVGKSTLTNALVGEKVAIVSNKPQTTRNRITAIVNRGDTQFVLMDTPGFHKPRTRLGDYMVNVVKESVADVDCVLLLVEPVAAVGPQEEELIARIRQSGEPAILVINKIDTVDKTRLLEVMALYSQAYDFDAILPISARTGEGLEELRTRVLALLRGQEKEITFLLPYSKAGELDALHSGGKVTQTEYTEEGILVRAVCRPETYGRLRAYVRNEE